MRNLMKSLWLRAFLQGTVFGDKKERFNTLYRVSDPWRMESGREQYRFQQTNRIIEEEFGRLDTLLEIGCGEGHQSEYLIDSCNTLYGIDVSQAAISRARLRCPSARLSVGDINIYSGGPDKFDLVVACEVLYYMKDVNSAIKRMNSLGSNCLITYFQSPPCELNPYLIDLPNVQSTEIQAEEISWKVVWWENRRVLE